MFPPLGVCCRGLVSHVSASLRVSGVVEAGNPLGACGVPGLAPEGAALPGHTPSSTLPTPSESGLVVCRRPAGGTPLSGEDVAAPHNNPKNTLNSYDS